MNFCLMLDLDDTLIPNAYTYFQPQLNMAGLIIMDLTYHCPPPSVIMNRATEIQVAEIARDGYISKFNFPQSYMTVYQELCEKAGREINKKVEIAIGLCGAKYFCETYTVYPGVVETLKNVIYKYNGALTTIIVTRGDTGIQQYKIDSTKLGQYMNHVEILSAKTKQTYLDIIEKYKLTPSKTVMVGDSLRNDIIPALEAGLYAIQINAEDATDWEKSLGAISVNPEFSKHYHAIKDFTEITDYLDKIFVPDSIKC